MTRMKILTIVLLAAALPLCVHGESGIAIKRAKVTEVGIFKARVINQSNAQAGWKSDGVGDVVWVQSTTNIPPRAGIQFGFRYNIEGTPTNTPIQLTIEHEQPQLKDPKTGATVLTNAVQIQSRIGQSYLLYTLETQDLIPGKWKFRVFYQDKKLCEQGFMVGLQAFQPRPVPHARTTNAVPAVSAAPDSKP